MPEDKLSKVTFKYLIPTDLKDNHVSGVFGGISPSGTIFCQFFSERLSIPDQESYEILSNGNLGNLVDLNKEGDIIRTVQASIAFNLPTAKQILKFLQEQIEKLEPQS